MTQDAAHQIARKGWRAWGSFQWPALVIAGLFTLGILTFPLVALAIGDEPGTACEEPGPEPVPACDAEGDVPPDPAVGEGEYAIAASSQTGPPRAGIVWHADHEEGNLADWDRDDCGGQFNNGTAYTEFASRLQNHTDGMRLHVPNMNSGRSEGARAFRWCEAQQHHALFYSAWYYFPRQVQVHGWWWIMEWKSQGSFNAKFGLAVVNRQDGEMELVLARGADSGGGIWEQDGGEQDYETVPVGRWVHLEVYYEKATDKSGRVSVWQDGARIIDASNVRTSNSDDLGWAIVNYGQYTSPSDVEIYVDDAAISTQRLGP